MKQFLALTKHLYHVELDFGVDVNNMDSHCLLSRWVALGQSLDPSSFLSLENNINIDLKKLPWELRKYL